MPASLVASSQRPIKKFDQYMHNFEYSKHINSNLYDAQGDKMNALLYLDDSVASGKFPDGLGQIPVQDVQLNLLYVIKPYLEMTTLDQDVWRGRTLLSEVKSSLLGQGCRVNQDECVIGKPFEKIYTWAKEWNAQQVIIYRQDTMKPTLFTLSELEDTPEFLLNFN